ncbi:MAG: hypothetical protein J6112_03540 [Clostridia bacterium]|nr:hypothetical protein [Clostridia bacterium]
MDELYELKEMLMKELEEYGRKSDLSAGSLEIVDKLTHTIKNLCKIIEAYEEEEYSGAYEGGSYRRSYRQGGNQGGGSYREGGSYRQGVKGTGRYSRRGGSSRYSREGGYSRHGEDMVMQLRELMEEAPDEQTRMEIQRLVQKMEQM